MLYCDILAETGFLYNIFDSAAELVHFFTLQTFICIDTFYFQL